MSGFYTTFYSLFSHEHSYPALFHIPKVLFSSIMQHLCFCVHWVAKGHLNMRRASVTESPLVQLNPRLLLQLHIEVISRTSPCNIPAGISCFWANEPLQNQTKERPLSKNISSFKTLINICLSV